MNRSSYYSPYSPVKSPDSVAKIYLYKIIFLLTYLGFFHLITQGVFLLGFVASIGAGVLLLLVFYDKDEIQKNHLHEIFYVLVLYSLLPYWTPLWLYFLSSVLLIVIMRQVFFYKTGFFHPVVMVMLAVFILYFLYLEQYELQSVQTISFLSNWKYLTVGHDFSLMNFEKWTDWFFVDIYTPAHLGGIGLLVLFVLFKKFYKEHIKTVFFFFLFVFGGLFLTQGIINGFGDIEALLYNSLYQIVVSNVIFIGIFVVSEQLSSGSTYKVKKRLAVTQGFLTGCLMSTVIWIPAPILALAVGSLILNIYEYYLFQDDKLI